jgi:tetratricopeptide (TPR) repeat protein
MRRPLKSGKPAWPWRSPVLALISAALLAGCGEDEPVVSDANQKYLEASDLLAKGQTDQAIEALNASIEAGPTLWSYRMRAKLLAEKGNDKAALEDCEAGLKIIPDDPDLLWIKGELAKPAAKRFQGKFKDPPSRNR